MTVLSAAIDYRFSIAPMMEWTDRHCRVLHRMLSEKALLYTEMVTTGAIIHGDVQRHLGHDAIDAPCALQLGGCVAADLAKSARLGEEWGYQEINLNCGCPSNRVQNGRFGACLMKDAPVVVDAVKAMRDAVSIPVTIKHRIGVDEFEEFDWLCDFVGQVAEAGCEVFIVHARKAWLKGLSPKQNREVPPLSYETVYRLKAAFPRLTIIINGGVDSLDDVHQHLQMVDGTMSGRSAYRHPAWLASVDASVFGASPKEHRIEQVLIDYSKYVEENAANGIPVWPMVRHALGLFHGVRGGAVYRRYISEQCANNGARATVLREALEVVQGKTPAQPRLPA